MTNLYGNIDPRNIPSYSMSDAARYLRIPCGTIRSWTVGRKYPVVEGSKTFQPLIAVKKTKPVLLSFTNLVEIHVLRAIRHQHQIDLDKVRKALDYLDEQFNISHPLAHQQFHTDGVDLFIERYGALINASQQGQIALKEAFNHHLKRIELDDSGLAIKLYPFTRSHEENNPRLVVIDSRIAFGRLVIAETGIATSILAERYRAGESIKDLASDYNCSWDTIEEALRCELPLAA